MLEALACGEMGLAICYFYSLTPREFSNIATGFRKRQQDEFKNSWEQTRNIMWAVMAPHAKKGTNLIPSRVISFPWETSSEEQDLIDLDNLAAEVEEKNKLFWAKYDAKKNNEKTDC